MFFSIFSYVLYLLGEVKCSSMIYHYVMWKLSAEIKSRHYQGEYPNLWCQHFHCCVPVAAEGGLLQGCFHILCLHLELCE